MPRRRIHEEEENSERWLVSYADFITLLFAFFVVMYSVSSVNEGKYKVLTDSMEEVFQFSKNQKMSFSMGEHRAREVGGSDRMITLPMPGSYNADENYQSPIEGDSNSGDDGGDPLLLEMEEVSPPRLDDSEGKPINDRQAEDFVDDGPDEVLQRIGDNLVKSFSRYIFNDSISVNVNNDFIEIDIKSSILFASGEAVPSNRATDIILILARELREYPNAIRVEGFTDNIPIDNFRYPSNWELSASRAASIVRLLARGGIDPKRLAAVGYAEFQPVASNQSDLGRQKNRRVALIISKTEGIRASVRGQEGGKDKFFPANNTQQDFETLFTDGIREGLSQ